MKRKPLDRRKARAVMQLRVSTALFRSLNRAVKTNGFSRAEFVREAILEKLKRARRKRAPGRSKSA